ncbi:FtsB family cell division protein [Demequina aestuarii]|uniref:FtsB family cell division protein n=1 Tax=Demequina aestuarii TaxID=327095 RepID=UPI0007821E79|nr:septum formation initiator family protein [Demequina aestuarii]
MLTWRTAVILLVVALAIAVVAPTVRAYMDQQANLADLRAEAEVAQAEVDALNAEVARWDDPAFIVAQARERLAYVFPGETPYRVVDAESVVGPVAGSPAAARAPEVAAGAPWYDKLWDSFEVAGGEDSTADAATVEGADGASETGQPGGGTDAGDAESEQLTDVDFGG